MTVQITRETGPIGSFGQVTILVNDMVAGALANHQSIAVPVTPKTATLSIKGDKRSAITVQNGDQLTLTTNPLFLGLYLASVLVLFGQFFTDQALIKSICSFVFAGLILVDIFFVPRYKWVKETTK